ncbi:MAG: hypothetical protein ACK5O2_00520 [Microthrixaceae bacterium]
MDRSRIRGGVTKALPFVAGIALSSALIVQATTAAFTGATSNSSNAWSSANVTLVDDDSGTAMFNATDMVPGDTETACIKVTYNGGDVALDPVQLYSSVTDTGLAAHLDLTIEEGTGGAFSGCTGFTPNAGPALYTGTLANLGTSNGTYATGLDAFTPTTVSNNRTYRISATLGTDTPNSAQGSGAGAGFTWEVHSS